MTGAPFRLGILLNRSNREGIRLSSIHLPFCTRGEDKKAGLRDEMPNLIHLPGSQGSIERIIILNRNRSIHVIMVTCQRIPAGIWLFIRDRKSVVEGKSVSVSVDLGGRRIMKKKKILTIKSNKIK